MSSVSWVHRLSRHVASRRLSYNYHHGVLVATAQRSGQGVGLPSLLNQWQTTFTRQFSDKSKDESNSNNKIDNDEDDGDFFGKHYDDGPDKLGPTLPPNYVRDATTGRLTGQVQSELTPEQEKVLKADPLQQDALLAERVERHWSSQDDSTALLSQLGQRVRQAQRDLNILGRSPEAQAATSAAPEPEDEREALTQRLTPQEMKEFKAYMKKHHNVDLQDDDMPVMDAATSNFSSSSSSPMMDTDWAIQWRSEQAQRQMDDLLDDNPYADIMPQDLSTSRLVNRKQAKPLPRSLLTHTNVALLQSFLTETGQIKARVQTRLGARDQRKVAKLVKRARAMGLIPYQGPFKVEQHGWIHDPSLSKPRPWEVEMERRGLTLRKQQQQGGMADNDS